MAGTLMKRCRTGLIIRGMQSKTTSRYELTLVRIKRKRERGREEEKRRDKKEGKEITSVAKDVEILELYALLVGI